FGNKRHVTAIVFSPDGRHLLTGCYDGAVRLWDVQNGNQVRPFAGLGDKVRAAAFSQDGREIAALGGFKEGGLGWQKATGKVIRRFSKDGLTLGLAFTPDRRLLLTTIKGYEVELWDDLTGRTVHSFRGHSSSVNAAILATDGTRLLTCSEDKTACLW